MPTPSAARTRRRYPFVEASSPTRSRIRSNRSPNAPSRRRARTSSTTLAEAARLGESPLEIRSADDARAFICRVTRAFSDILSNVLFDAPCEETSSSKPTGGLRDACVASTRRWSDALLAETRAEDGDGRGGETAFESLVRRTIMDLGGEETDPKRAMTRALIAMSLSKFTLGSGLKKAYARPDAARRLWTECARRAKAELATQIKALTQGLFCAHHSNDADDVVGDVTREGVDAFAAECVDAVAYARARRRTPSSTSSNARRGDGSTSPRSRRAKTRFERARRA